MFSIDLYNSSVLVLLVCLDHNQRFSCGRLLNSLFPPRRSRSYLDMAKVLVFRHLFWLVLSVVFITGATRISIFGFGYLLACFFFLLFGTKLLVKTSRTRLTLWDCLIIYNVGVIISKNMLSVSMWTLASPFMLQIVEMKNAVIIVVKV